MPSSSSAISSGAERLERQRGRVGDPGGPARPALGELGSGEAADEDRVLARPVEQLLEEVEQALVGPVHVLEQQDHRIAVREPLEEQPPGREQLLAHQPRLGGSQQRPERLGDPLALAGVLDPLLEPGGEPRVDLGRGCVVADPEPLADHVGERPVGDPVAEGEAAAEVPEHLDREPVDVVVELGPEPGLADPGGAADPDQARDLAVDAGVEEVLDQPQLRRPADERRLRAGPQPGPGGAADHPQRPVEVQRLGLALDRVLAGVLERDRCRGALAGRGVDVHRPRGRHDLDPRGRIDPVADHQPLARVLDRGDLAGGDARPRLQVGRADRLAEARDRVDQLEPGADRALGVVAARDRHPPDRHHRVADELLDRAAVAVDHRPGEVEVAAEQVADVLDVAALRERRVADQVDEQHRGDPELGAARGRGPRRRRVERRAALVAEGLAGFARGAAARAGELERGSARAAEARPLLVLGLAAGADHGCSVSRQADWRPSASASSTMIFLRSVRIAPRPRNEESAWATDSREEPVQPASSSWEIGRVITTPSSVGSP